MFLSIMEYEIGLKEQRGAFFLSQACTMLSSRVVVMVKSRRGCFQKQEGEMDQHKMAIWLPHILPLSFQGEETKAEAKC